MLIAVLITAMFCPLDEFVNMMPKAAEANEHADLDQIIKRVCHSTQIHTHLLYYTVAFLFVKL
jgi:hypothetical protein